MFDKVIIGIDGTPGSHDALTLARELAAPQAEIVLAHVSVELVSAGQFAPEMLENGGARWHVRQMLETERANAGIDATLKTVVTGSVGRGLHELAESSEAQLIVVGSSRLGLLGRVIQGNAMRAALNGAPCAVAVAPAGYSDQPRLLREIGVGYDGSHEARQALAVARELAADRGARVSVFEAVSLPLHGFPDARRLSAEGLEAEIGNTRKRLAELGDVDVHAAYGDPAEELALYGASVDLLIVGSRGYGPLGRLIHGSTSLRLARSARCPLLVLPRMATTQARDDEVAAAGATVRG
jgi:nucleotide-binding universal stress UspA family protein